MQYVLGVDIGGTFTDCVVTDDQGRVTLGKALSTPQDFSVGAINAVSDAAKNLGLPNERAILTATKVFFHACTVGDNTLITRSGAKAALITTKGFADTLLMMRGRTTDGLTEEESFHISALTKPDPIIPRSLVAEVHERIDYKGAVIVELSTEEAEEIVKGLIATGVKSIGICLLWSILNDKHELLLADIIRQHAPAVYVSLSSHVAPFLGEYERTATTAFNAYIAPKIAAYLETLGAVLRANGLKREPLIMQSYGGVLGVADTCKNAVGTIESGPASGVVGTLFTANRIGLSNILATDMGGTTFKVSVIRNGTVEKDYKPVILRHQLFLTKIWVESIGAGGGSIAWIDADSGLLKVGPQGAGADPGPVCYGLGGDEPTVSDADLVLGYLNPDYFLGGKLRLHKETALTAVERRIAKPLGMDVIEAASGIYRIINSHMGDLIRKATVERGYDPRDFTVFAYGGAAAVHAARYAAELGVKQVIVPLTASVHGAMGLISSDVVYEYGKSDHLLVPADLDRINGIFSCLVAEAITDLRSAGFNEGAIRVTRSIDIRYRYQVHELNVPFRSGTRQISADEMDELYHRFDELYEQTYGAGSGYREAGKEIMVFRVVAVGELDRPAIRKYVTRDEPVSHAIKGQREAYFEEYRRFVRTDIYDFDRMSPGAVISGPAIIETPITTIVVNPNDTAAIDEFRNVRISIQHSSS